MRPEPGQVLHFSEDPAITRFVPHVAATARQRTPYVWAVDAPRCPDYWFPRECPRAMAWTTPTSGGSDLLGPGETRLHAIEHHWLERLRTTRLYAYRLPAAAFTPFGDHAHVCTHPVDPLGPAEPVGDLLALHEEAGIQLRLLANLWPLWDAITTSTLGYSGIRLRNARPRP
ncbi:DUF6886 family protein [Umezawaea tangerina]|uniref:Uncharacterized protein n=1 Tax=Umezawaea tangerina TaxID=84725 RepID=A0A2T0TJ49_9PSEU|nr:DUF6886 family protein [Umezawaea tangerina]PRY45744.1 hypothetical protein CLV43_1013 [Umezawaea tangerina]